MAWPKALQDAHGPMRLDKLDGALEGMGDWGDATRSLAELNLMQPDMMTGLTLFILSSQPRDPDKQSIPGGGGGVAGGVWVRERFTIHQPLARTEQFHVTGEAVGRHVHKGRRYGTNTSQTYSETGELVASNVTTGLLAYKVQEGLSDQVEGMDPNQIHAAGPDWQAAVNNPCLPALQNLQAGDQLGGELVTVSLQMMQARDTKRPDNPIHSDPEQAKKAGLSQPIAGGSHVLAFTLEPIMARCGAQCLLHGAAYDIRWKAPVFADAQIMPLARVTAVAADRVCFELTATLEDGRTAMVGDLVVPLVETRLEKNA